MKYFGTLGEVKDTMVEAHKTLGQLHLFTKEAAWLLNRNSGGLRGLGGPGSSSEPGFGAPNIATISTLSTGETQTVYDNGNVSIFNPSTGNTVTTTTAGGAQVKNSAGQVIASSGNNPTPTQVAGDAVAATIAAPFIATGQAAANAASGVGAGITNLFDGLVSSLKSAAGLAVVVGVIYLVYKDGEK